MSSNLDSFMAKISIGLSESKILSSSMCADRLLIFSEANLKPRLDGAQWGEWLVMIVMGGDGEFVILGPGSLGVGTLCQIHSDIYCT